MRKQVRGPCPDFLAERWERFGLEWEAKLAEKTGASWDWRQVDSQPVNQRLIPFLKEQTLEHCSFCDVHPVKPPSDEPIEHFRPKRKFPRLAWQWENLFYCCRCCQEKGDDWEESLLKPDEEGYEFGHYFMADFTTGEIKPLEGLTEVDWKRAEITLRLYGLNDNGHPARRLATSELRSELRHRDINQFSYRDFLEAGEP